MKVKAVKDFRDLERQQLVSAGDEWEVSEARAKELTTTNNKAGMVLCTLCEEAVTPDAEKKVKPRKKTDE